MYDDLKTLCQDFDIPFVEDLSSYRFVKDKVQFIPYSTAKTRCVLPVDETEELLFVALENPLDLETIEEIRFITEKKIREICAPSQVIFSAIERCYHQKEDVASALIASLKENTFSVALETEGYDLLDQSTDSPVVQLLNVVLTEAIQQGASDIHFEPLEQGVNIRYRIDGILQLRHQSPKELQGQLITRIKVLAKLDIAEQRLPQDGRIKLKIGGREIDFRVSTIHVIYGERVVLRILDRGNVILGLDRLGMPSDILTNIKKLICLNEGIFLVTGPTGSGKTTTLYSVLSEINTVGVNIMTIEDPVEYKLPNMAQVGVNPKIELYFNTGLRSMLRQDPDILMVGEIRDKETAEIAIQASLTGHLVFSTLHTNDAPSALTRLAEMDIEPYLLSSTVVGILAQRLVRMICRYCCESYQAAEIEYNELGIENSIPLYRGRGCSHCFGLGYKGRHGIYELLFMNHAIKKQTIKSADAVSLRQIALNYGMRSLRESGSDLVRKGITTSTELLRVTRNYDLSCYEK